MTLPYLMLALHVLGASVWAGGHLVLALTVLPRALREQSVEELERFEAAYERIGIPALVLQVVTGLWLAARLMPVDRWLDLSNPVSRVVLLKLALLVVTAALGVDARLRLIPGLTAERLPALAAHVIPVTVMAVVFVLAGVSLRFGGI